jgi:hypothetical protein
MKRLLVLLSVFTFCFAGFAQNMCTSPISTSYFNTEYANINSMSNATSKINYATNFANNNCLYANQIKQISMLFSNDQDKLTFAKASYRNCWDKDNFYDVYDAFAYFSNVFRLHDYVISQRGTNNNNNTTTVVTTTYEFPNYTYPDYSNYFGITGCNMPIDEATFNTNYQGFRMSKLAENAKVISIKDFINKTCLSTAQIMKLANIPPTESNRLDILKSSYPRVYDRGNYSYAEQLLTNQTYRLDFEAFLKQNGGTTTTIITTNTNCTVSASDMTDIKKSINAASFDNTKITTAKQILAAKKCFSVAQIKEILQLFSFESSKLEVAKYAYDFCIDKSNYYQVNDVFSFSSSKDDLTKYVQSKQ